jgi:hypothetical protein
MAKVLSKTGIVTGEQVDAWHVTQSIDAFTKVEAYDITVSGSFTLTGSLKLSGSLVGDTTGTSSFSDLSSYSLYSEATDYALTSSFNQTDIYTLQFNHAPLTLNNSTTYYIGAGNDPTSTYYGIIVPVDSFISAISISITNNTPGTSEKSNLSLISTTAGTLWSDTGNITHDAPFISIIDSVTSNINKGDDLYFRLDTPSWSSKPLQTTHNFILTLTPYQQ